jgi:GTP-binding protein
MEEEKLVVKKVEFLLSVPRQDMLPVKNMPEYAFVGRSNVGKSSLINMLVQKKNLAHTSGQPGKTQTINLYEVDNSWLLADLPGYGFAKASKAQREQFRKMITHYLTQRANLINVFVLVDSRLEPQNSDLEQIDFMGENAIPFSIVFTKTDKLSQSQLAKNLSIYEEALAENWQVLPPMFYTSAEKGRGRDELLEYIRKMNFGGQGMR